MTSWRIFSVSRHASGSGPAAFRVVTSGAGLCEQFLNVVVDLGESGVAQEIGGQSHGVRGHQVPAFEQTEPCRLDSGQVLQFFDGRTAPRCRIAERWRCWR